jgi:transcriptional regulator with XRE-family HTH domain
VSDRAVTPATTYAAIVGAAVARLRDRHGATQADCAAAMELAPSTWSRIEHGTSALTIDQLARFAVYVRCAPADVLALADDRRAAIEARGVAVLLDRRSATEAMARGYALVSAGTLAEFFAAT